MARINIEDSIFKEKSFEKLMFKLGSRRAALGALVEAFQLAQKHYLTTVNDRLIPLNEWQREEIADELIDCGFAEIRENGIYVRGSDEQFGWLVQRSEAGKKSAQSKAEKKAKLVESRSTTVQRPLTTVNGSQPLPLSLPLSHKENTTTKQKNETDLKNKINHAWKIWSDSLKLQKIPPSEISLAQESSLARAINQLGFENVIDALEGFRYEKEQNGFNPKTQASLDYVLHRNLKTSKSNWERLANLARLEREKNKASNSDEAERIAIYGSKHL